MFHEPAPMAIHIQVRQHPDDGPKIENRPLAHLLNRLPEHGAVWVPEVKVPEQDHELICGISPAGQRIYMSGLGLGHRSRDE